MQGNTLTGMASELLAAVVDDLTNPPDRQFIAHGPGRFALDCEMVAVSISSGYFDNYQRGEPSCLVTPVWTFDALWQRCYPSLDGDGIPTPAELTEASQVLNADVAAVTIGISARWNEGTLFSNVQNHCGMISLGQITPVGPSGGFAGYRMLVIARL